MPSPFPGMNPYLEREAVWNDFHVEFCKAIKKSLVPQVQPEFIVKFNEHIFVREAPVGLSDVSLTSKKKQRAQSGGAVGLLEAPVQVRIGGMLEEERIPFLEIFDREDNTLVTIIELLSPTNKKSGKDRNQFLDKRLQILMSSVHYVEIDLLRGGPRLPIEEMPACDYYVLVSRAETRPEGLWPLSLREPLPVIPIPLPEPKREVRIPLQDLLHQVYDEAGYANYIYSGPPRPRLRPKEAQWARKYCPDA